MTRQSAKDQLALVPRRQSNMDRVKRVRAKRCDTPEETVGARTSLRVSISDVDLLNVKGRLSWRDLPDDD
jgi:hypothetical protein